MTIDYSKTIRLPQTDFPRRAGLPQKEPEILARWERMGIYKRQRAQSAGKPKFVLHMGPPFANGNIHLGHVLSTVLKDVVCRSYQMLGHDAPLVPGWDCHGLPIEWKVEENFRAAKSNVTKESDPVGFRTACRDFAATWVGVQAGEFKRLGINGDFENPYQTMDRKSEALIAAEIHKFLLNGSLYRGSKPVMWSVAEQTALAEAEIEYKDITSDTVFVCFPLDRAPAELAGADIVIWTTTPWTLPGNRAIGYGEAIDYVGIEAAGQKLVMAEALLDSVKKTAEIAEAKIFWRGRGADLSGAVAKHPLHGQGYDFPVPLLAGDFVTTDAGTGFVHIAPGHGEDDYRLGIKHGIDVPHTVKGDGVYFDDVPLFAGVPVYFPDGKKGPANKLVMAAIAEAGKLLAKGQIQHSYPHSWRSKAPVIFRNTPQWFISMEKNGLRGKAMAEIAKTRFVPERGRNRIGSMVETRGDWCVSRQRAWGVPIAIFVDKKTGQPLADEKVLNNIFAIFEREGSDAWYNRPAADFLGAGYNPDDYEQVTDIIDVWFESGSTQAFVLEQRPELSWPADLYLEGSDQHRGWFQSSLLVAAGTRGAAPYKAVLTHGFILDEKGYKMSKSAGNGLTPAELMQNYGADILRLWVTGSDYTEDIKFGESILKAHVDVYRRIRNTFVYLLGSFDGSGDAGGMNMLDRYMLHRLYEIDQGVRRAVADFDFQGMTTLVHNFCARDLSAFYFDICKDVLYCEAKDSPRRRAVVYVLDQVFNHLVHWLSPVLSFTCEEAWLSYKGASLDDDSISIHLSTLPEAPAAWRDDALAAAWDKIIAVRGVVTAALEPRRAAKEIGASLEAAPEVYIEDQALAKLLVDSGFADICIVSGVTVVTGKPPADAFTLPDVAGAGVVFKKAAGGKCDRCWKYTPEVGQQPQHPSLCKRCADVVARDTAAAA